MVFTIANIIILIALVITTYSVNTGIKAIKSYQKERGY